MHWLDCYNNQITTLVPGASTGMTHLDLHNNAVLDLELSTNTAMKYFDCDNNHLRELTFPGAADIETIHANSNNLFQINMGATHQALSDVQFENNHINAIDLSGCKNGALTAQGIKDANNGRSIVANCGVVNSKKLYYFQLENTANGGRFLNDETCTEDGDTYGRHAQQGATTGPKSLADDGLDLSKITWAESPVVGNRFRSRASDYELDPDLVVGTIAVLENTSTDPSVGSGREVYAYDNGISQSEFYLNWSANADIITSANDIQQGDLVIEGGNGCVSVTAPQPTEIIITDVNGRIVAQRSIDVGTTAIDGLACGIYIVNGHKVPVK